MILQFFISNVIINGDDFILSDASKTSLTEKEYDLEVHFLYILMKSLKLMSDEWFSATCWSSLLFGIFIMKKWVEFSLTSFGTLNYDFVIKTIKKFSFLPLRNKSVTFEFSFLLLIISAIISSKTINILILYLHCILQYFCQHLAYHLNTQ